MIDAIVISLVCYSMGWFFTCMLILPYSATGKAMFGTYFVWPLFWLKYLVRVVRASGRLPMSVVGAVHASLDEWRKL